MLQEIFVEALVDNNRPGAAKYYVSMMGPRAQRLFVWLMEFWLRHIDRKIA